MEQLFFAAYNIFAVFGIVYFLLLTAQMIVLFYFSARVMKREQHKAPLRNPELVMRSPISIPITLIAPAYNERHTIVQSVQSLLKLHYGEFEIIVVNDGSTDDTLRFLTEEFALQSVTYNYEQFLQTKSVRAVYLSAKPQYKNLIVIDKENGGKADALNTGINFARYPLFCAMDADSLLDPDALLHVTRPFYQDDEVVAVGGTIRPVNGCSVKRGYVTDVSMGSSVPIWTQTIDYIRSFQYARSGWDAMRSLLVISGAFGVFRKDTIIEIGGYRSDSVGEDMEIVVRLHHCLKDHKRQYKVRFVPHAICWTQAPPTLRALRRQRNRWQRGLFHTMMIHKRMVFNPKYGIVGMFAMPYF
ncbi:MAG TPA: glycosyltransferase family 2 protein, partial [Candidatus Kapabacteria bacterium]|nr:glycosyltransferase family 2 protein [Candidatus Kapabacteria bacterium]